MLFNLFENVKIYLYYILSKIMNYEKIKISEY